MLMINNMDDLTIKISGKNYFTISAMGTNITFSGDGSLEEGIIFSDGGTIEFESGSYHLKAKYSEEAMSGPNLFVMFDGDNIPKELIKISPELEIKEDGVKIYYNVSEEDYFATSYLVGKNYDPDDEELANQMASDVHIAPKAKKQTNITSTETNKKTETESEQNSEKFPNTGHFQKELSVTLTSIIGTAAIVAALGILAAFAKKKSKKGISYY